ncbi:TPA: phospho-N-acetylmuramoyl-pentapeptide-transferase [Candidatus Sumerlaeota bacterium]|nr:phospho-N-acetylmuramoyl-pentapeptide-transferase [Candidatus Sumerlaeota bacterium]
MLYELLKSISWDLAVHSPLQILSYITVRAVCALIFAFVISLVVGPGLIHYLTALKVGQPVREFKNQQFNIHQHKSGTPTMGGVLIVISTLSASLLFCNPYSSYVWMALFVFVGAGALGFWDDYTKVVQRNNKGISGKQKIIVQVALGAILGAFLYFTDDKNTVYTLRAAAGKVPYRGADYLLVPFVKTFYIPLGIFIIAWAAFVITAASNAVNLTDGLDGLAIGTSLTVIFPYLVISYLAGNFMYAQYLYVPYVPQAGELAVILAALFGSALGFLWFNAHPAQVFMGDTGSLSLGAGIGAIALLCKQELLLVIVGGIFVVEALSVIIQVGYFKITRGKRFFLMSPLHNHFVKKNIHESRIIMRFLIVSLLLALAGLSTLKLR